jgi:hypothetical protein
MAIQRMSDKWIRRVQALHPEVEVTSVWHRGGSGHTHLRVYAKQDGEPHIWWFHRQTGDLTKWSCG